MMDEDMKKLFLTFFSKVLFTLLYVLVFGFMSPSFFSTRNFNQFVKVLQEYSLQDQLEVRGYRKTERFINAQLLRNFQSLISIRYKYQVYGIPLSFFKYIFMYIFGTYQPDLTCATIFDIFLFFISSLWHVAWVSCELDLEL